MYGRGESKAHEKLILLNTEQSGAIGYAANHHI